MFSTSGALALAFGTFFNVPHSLPISSSSVPTCNGTPNGVFSGVRFKNTTDHAISVHTHAWQSPQWKGHWSAGYIAIATTFLPGDVSDEIPDIGPAMFRFLDAGMEPLKIPTCWERLLREAW